MEIKFEVVQVSPGQLLLPTNGKTSHHALVSLCAWLPATVAAIAGTHQAAFTRHMLCDDFFNVVQLKHQSDFPAVAKTPPKPDGDAPNISSNSAGGRVAPDTLEKLSPWSPLKAKIQRLAPRYQMIAFSTTSVSSCFACF